MRIHQLILSCVCSLFVLFTTTLSFAQDDNSEQNYNSEVSEIERYNTEISLGVGIGIEEVSMNAEFLHQFGEYWRVGLTEKVNIGFDWADRIEGDRRAGDLEYVASTTLFMNEFVAYHGDIFEFTPRLGVGIQYIKKYYNEPELVSDYYSISIAVLAGLGFGWQVSEHINIGFNFDYTFSYSLSYEYKYKIDLPDDQKNEENDLLHLFNLYFTVGYRF